MNGLFFIRIALSPWLIFPSVKYLTRGDRLFSMKKRVATWLKIVSILAMLVSLFLVYEHFSEAAERFCTFGESFDCGIVNKSPYASIDGILYFLLFDVGVNVPLLNLSQYGPLIDFLTTNAFWGFLTFLFVFLSAGAIGKEKRLFSMETRTIRCVLLWLLWFSVVYALYLVYIELFILKTICVFCVALDVLIVVALILLYNLKGGKP